MAFGGPLLKNQKAPVLWDIAWTLDLTEDGTCNKLIAQITTFFDDPANRYLWEDNCYISLFVSKCSLGKQLQQLSKPNVLAFNLSLPDENKGPLGSLEVKTQILYHNPPAHHSWLILTPSLTQLWPCLPALTNGSQFPMLPTQRTNLKIGHSHHMHLVNGACITGLTLEK